MKILSFNLRVNTAKDGKHAWPYRQKEAINFMLKGDYDVIGLQEVTFDMYDVLKKELKNYEFIYQPRDEQGESAPLLIKKDMYKMVEQGTFWLTDTPFMPSKVEGSVFNRTASYAVLQTKSNQIIVIFNTHLDYQQGIAIYHQAEYLYEMILNIQHTYQARVVITGDFNQNPQDMAIRFLSSFFKSSYQRENKLSLTYHGYTDQQEGLPIDYIFVSDDLTPKMFMIHHHTSDIYLSDHYPISLEI